MEGVVSEACGTAVASARGKAGRKERRREGAGNGDGNGGRGMGGKKGPTRSKAGKRASRQPLRPAGNLAEVGGGGLYPELFPLLRPFPVEILPPFPLLDVFKHLVLVFSFGL